MTAKVGLTKKTTGTIICDNVKCEYSILKSNVLGKFALKRTPRRLVLDFQVGLFLCFGCA